MSKNPNTLEGFIAMTSGVRQKKCPVCGSRNIGKFSIGMAHHGSSWKQTICSECKNCGVLLSRGVFDMD